MSETPNPQMSPEETEAFMKATPSREEVNRYMNNLYVTVNNSFGMYQGYTIMAMALTLKEYFAKLDLDIDKDEFLKSFFGHNQELLKEASDAVAKMKDSAPTEAESSEVDVSML